MGSWQETDAITHLPIYCGQPCVMVLMKEGFAENYVRHDSHIDIIDWISKVESVNFGKYDDYGWIEDLPQPKVADKNGFERNISLERVTIFFHKEVWDKIVPIYRNDAIESINWHKKLSITDSNLIDFASAINFASHTRRDLLICEKFHGYQTYQLDDFKTIDKLSRKIQSEIKKRFES